MVVAGLDSEFYRALLEFAPDALIVADAQGVIAYANATAHTLFGYEPGALCGAPIEQLIPESSRAAHIAHRRVYMSDPQPREMGDRSKPLLGQRRDGSIFHADIRLAPLHILHGTAIVAAVRDATERERLMALLRAAKETADEANATKGRFLAAASHDLRQPLQTLRLLNGTLKRLARDPAMLEILEQEERALGTMSELLNALLNVTKLESGSVQPNLSVLALADIFDDLRQQFANPAKLKNLDLQVTATDLTVRTDGTLLRELLQNLLANAIRYTDKGHVILRQRRDPERHWIDVEDTGVGIPTELLDKIFEDFFQARNKNSMHRGGVGLGLGIVRRLSRMLGLPVVVTSTPGSGSRFSVDVTSIVITSSLPVAGVPQATQPRKRGQRVLLIDDEQSMRVALRTYLQLDDHRVDLAGSLSEVEAFLDRMESPPDIVISDFHLGNRELGSDAIARIRARFGSHVPAIILTGDTSRIPDALSTQPLTRMLNKPVDVQLLMTTMDELLMAKAPT